MANENNTTRSKKAKIATDNTKAAQIDTNKKSLEEIYFEKLREHKTAKKIDNAEELATPKTSTARPKGATKKTEKTDSVEAKGGNEEVLIGNIIIDKSIVEQGIPVVSRQASSKTGIIIMLAVMITIVIFISSVLVYFNLSRVTNGHFIDKHDNVNWVVDNANAKGFALPDEFSNGSIVYFGLSNEDAGLYVKTDKNGAVSLKIQIKMFVKDDEIYNPTIQFLGLNDRFLPTTEPLTYTLTLTDSAGVDVLFCRGFMVNYFDAKINNKNFKIDFILS